GVFLVAEAAGFALGRVILDEAELLTLAVDPDHQRRGVGCRLLAGFEAKAQNQGATRAFLEVATTNLAAKSLYAAASWRVDGLRKGYYRAKPQPIDAAMMSKAIPNA
ncbi:MAG: GNAT family N-acetyltransferase, partial [Paracoccaceae bacterium]